MVQQSEWKKASAELNQVQHTYESKYQWKDFYITPENYTILVGFLGELKGAIKEKDRKQAMIQLSAIKSFIKQVYYQ